jgi:hypothetical protein
LLSKDPLASANIIATPFDISVTTMKDVVIGRLGLPDSAPFREIQGKYRVHLPEDTIGSPAKRGPQFREQ